MVFGPLIIAVIKSTYEGVLGFKSSLSKTLYLNGISQREQ